MKHQGYKVNENIIFKDIKSTLILERNRKVSSLKRTKCIKVRYFFVKHKIKKGEVEVKYCPTEKKWLDVLIKTLKGEKNRKMRSNLMNCPEDYYKVTNNNLYPGGLKVKKARNVMGWTKDSTSEAGGNKLTSVIAQLLTRMTSALSDRQTTVSVSLPPSNLFMFVPLTL